MLAAFAVAPVALSAPAHAETSATTLLSVDFEDGTKGPLQQSGAAGTVVTVPGTTNKAYEITDRKASYDGLETPSALLDGLPAGTVVSLSMKAMLAPGTTGSYGARWVKKPDYSWAGDNTPLSARAWTTVTGTYTVGASDSGVTFYTGTGADTGDDFSYLLDDITVTSTAPANSGAGSSDSTVLSSNFDDGTSSPWVSNGNATLSVVPDPSGTGKSLKAAGITAGYAGPAVDLMPLLTPGVQYTVSFRARLADASQPADSVHFTVDDGNYTWIGNPTAIGADAWTTITGTYTLAANATKATMYVDSTLPTGQAAYPDLLIDDVTITGPASSTGGGTGSTCAYPTSDTLINSDFESGDQDGWVARSDANGAATVGIVSGGHDSDHALQASGRTDQGQGVGHDVTCLLEPGQTYEFSGWVRFGAGQPTDDVWLSLANTVGGSTTYTTLGQFTNVTNGGWSQIDQKFTMPASSDAALLYVETKYYSDGSAGNTSDLLFDDLSVTKPAPLTVQDITPIKDTLPFPVGAAVSDPQLAGAPGQLLKRHFDQVTPENAMKPESWYDADHSFKTTNADADTLMNYAEANDMRVYGHNLVWYQQTPDWFFQDDQGQWLTNSSADQATMRQRLDDHIKNVAQYLSSKFGAFGSSTNPLVSFDVVNEAVSDNVGDPDDLRQSHWYQILGPEYIEDAFDDANKYFDEPAADGGYAVDGTTTSSRPIALFYNDYNTEQAGKRSRVQELVNRLIADGVPIDGIGHQFHVTMSTPVSTLKDAIDAFNGIRTAASTGGHPLYQAVTELDVPTGTPVTEANLIDQGYYYKSVFDMLRDEAGNGASIFSATVWGLTDSQSWRASSGAPLLFDDDLQAKPAYYGATDQALPAKQLSAIVFQQDGSDVDASSAASAADVTGDVEWSQLPLHRVSDDAGFQLRWAGDHLTAYVESSDASDDATDEATFTWGSAGSPSTATVKRDGTVTGTGVTAKVTSTGTGWKAVVDLPTGALTAQSTPTFDVGVTDGDDTEDWNTPGSLGTLQLVEPLSFTTIPEADTAPTIDGTKDAVWSQASTVTTSKRISGAADGAKATVYQLWKDNYLYVLADVTDPTVDTSSPNAYEQDSVEIFTDPGNAKNGSYRPDDAQMRISADNAESFGGGDSEAAQQARLTSATSRTATGYVVEARIDLKDGNTGVGAFEGLDYEVNDGTDGARTANFGWAEQTGTAYQTTSRWGVGELVGPATFAPVITTQPVSVSGHAGTTVRLVAAADARPAATVVWQQLGKHDRSWTTIAGATDPSLSVKVNASLDGTRYRAVFTNSAGSTTTDAATLTVERGKP